MGYQIYRVGPRWGGYGVPAVCEYPSCDEEIDRGMSYACGGEPFSEYGCDRYFCGKHLHLTCVEQGDGDHYCETEDANCQLRELCERCHNWYEGGRGKAMANFPYKPEKKEWVKHLLTDESWAEWRKNNPGEVDKLKQPNK